jgi:small-conductance mechanosensitive channel
VNSHGIYGRERWRDSDEPARREQDAHVVTFSFAAVHSGSVSHWLRGDGLAIVMLITGSVLLARLIRWTAARIDRRLADEAARQREAEVVASAETKHFQALGQVVSWCLVVLVYFVTVVLVVQRLGLPIASLVAPATVAGIGFGFGAQRLVQDFLAGFFLVVERQYGFGDLVRIGAPGTTTGISGTIEELTLRTTSLRTINGELVTIPNGEIRQVTNLSRDWARAVIDVPVPTDQDIAHASEVLRRVGQEAFADDELQRLLLDAPSVMGVESLDTAGFVLVRLVARTRPGRQAEVGRLLRARIAEAFQEEGIVMGPASVSTARAQDR